MPEQTEAENAPENVGPVTLGEHLRHHRQQPQQAGGDVKAVASDQRKKGREERAPRWTRPVRDHVRKLPEFEAKKRSAKYEGRRHRAIEPNPVVCLGAAIYQTAREARDKK